MSNSSKLSGSDLQWCLGTARSIAAEVIQSGKESFTYDVCTSREKAETIGKCCRGFAVVTVAPKTSPNRVSSFRLTVHPTLWD